jgi:hypothetical protein
MSRGHTCPLCRAPRTTYRPPTCGHCWPGVPAAIQRRLSATWPRRTRHPAPYHEALAELLLWAREARAPMRQPEEVRT